MAQEMAVLSPEKTILSFRLAGIAPRMLAHLLDAALVIFLLFVLLMALLRLGPLGMAMWQFSIWITVFGYFILFEGFWNGQTLGKKALGLRVRMVDGTPVTFTAVLGRNLLRIADFFPSMYFLGVLAIFTNPKSQRVGDLVAGTIVVHEKRALPIFTPTPYWQGIHPFEDHVGELRGMTQDEYVALRRLCDRFPELPTQVQERLIQEVYVPIAVRRGVEPLAGVHPLYLAEAMVMRYGRARGLL
jgi:uncharacterized RDD family membrane protein YckC